MHPARSSQEKDPSPQPSPRVQGEGEKELPPQRGEREISSRRKQALRRRIANDVPIPQQSIHLLRPLRLLRQPRPITAIVRPSQSRDGQPISFTDGGQVHRLDHIRGPERITGQWWNGRCKTRDYFDALDTAGDRYWIFRVAQTGRWFLHGIFE